jgi:ribonuclease HI
MRNIRVYSNGLCYPNPNGAATWAFVVLDGELEIHSEGGLVRAAQTSNNLAEYTAFENALLYIEKNLTDKKVNLHVDSRLILHQTRGQWSAQAKHLIPFRNRCQRLYRENRGVRLYYCEPGENKAAPLARQVYREITGEEPADGRYFPEKQKAAERV